MKGFKVFIGIGILFLNFTLSGQALVKLKDWELRDLSKRAELERDYYTALDALIELDERKKLSDDERKTIALFYFKAKDFENALDWYKVLKEEYPFDPLMYYYHALCYKRLGKLGTALEYFKRMERRFDGQAGLKSLQDQIDLEKKGCEIGTSQGINKKISLIRLPENINLPHEESAPYYDQELDLLIYSSVRTTEYRFDDPKDIPHREVLLAEMNRADTAWRYAGKLNSLSEKNVDYDHFFYKPEVELASYTKCKTDRNRHRKCAIHTAKTSDLSRVVGVEIMTEFDPNLYNMSQATIAKFYDDYVLIFSADLPGGFGGRDLWLKSLTTNKPIKNLGKKINTPGNEESPWYDDSRSMLYFSSNGHASMGGMDIYKSNGNYTKWTDVENLGTPFNSSHDDAFYSHVYENDTLAFGFFTSTRPGGNSIKNNNCCADIFQFWPYEKIDFELEGQIDLESLIAGREPSKDGDLTLKLYQKDGDDLVFVNEVAVDENGRFKTPVQKGKDYVLKVDKEGYLSKSTAFNANEGMGNLDMSITEITKEPITVKNIYYPYDQSYLTESSKTVIDTTIYKILSDNPSIILEISSHTDWLGGDEYNLSLSQRRAESVVNYLLEKGISKDRLKAVGYGEYQPIAPNANPDGSDNPEGRQKNRRTEFKILGVLPNVDDIIYSE